MPGVGGHCVWSGSGMGDGEVVVILGAEDGESRLLLMCRDMGEEQRLSRCGYGVEICGRWARCTRWNGVVGKWESRASGGGVLGSVLYPRVGPRYHLGCVDRSARRTDVAERDSKKSMCLIKMHVPCCVACPVPSFPTRLVRSQRCRTTASRLSARGGMVHGGQGQTGGQNG